MAIKLENRKIKKSTKLSKLLRKSKFNKPKKGYKDEKPDYEIEIKEKEKNNDEKYRSWNAKNCYDNFIERYFHIIQMGIPDIYYNDNEKKIYR